MNEYCRERLMIDHLWEREGFQILTARGTANM